MTFLNALLALGALAFTVPLAIHLLARSKFRTVQWGAMHLLDSVIRINRRRIQLMHLLLLLLRCLLPVLLAFCLARPVLTGFHSLPGDAPQSIVLAIDDSRSMSARDQSGITRADRVKQQLLELFGNLSRRDEVILVRSSRIDAPPVTTGAQDAIARLRQLRSQSGPVDLGRLLRAAVDAADDASHTQRRVLIVSDFQSHNLDQAAMTSIGRLATTLAEKPVRPVISFLNLGIGSQQLANVSVDSVEIDSPAVVAGRGARFSAGLRNASDTPARDLRVLWSVDGKPLDPRIISIPPRSTITSRLSHGIDQVGVHEVTVSVEHGDALVADNRRSIAVDVIREVHVMMVDGKPSSRPLEGETDFLAIALSPFAFGGEDQPDAVRTTIVRNHRLEQELQKQEPDIVVLANVGRPSDGIKKSIARFVLGGGAVIFFDGSEVRAPDYNGDWSCADGSWRLPATLGEFVGSEASRDAQPLPVGAPSPLYSPWNLLGKADQQPLGEVDVYGYRRLNIEPDVPQGEPSSVDAEMAEDPSPVAAKLLSMANGDPLVVSARRGRGQVVQFAVPCDTAWTTLPVRMVYLPMMQQLVLDLAGSRKATTIEVGSGLAVPVSELTSQLPDDVSITDHSSGSRFTIQIPAQQETVIEPTQDVPPQLLLADTAVPGPYWIRQTTRTKEGEAVVTSTLRVVEVPAVESQLRDAEASRLAAAAKLVEASVYTDLQTLQSDDRTRRYGREIWRWLLVALLVLMIGELLLQQRSIRAPVVGAS